MRQKLIEIGKNLKNEIEFYKILSADVRIPKLSKFLLAAAVFYLLSPIDIIPDFIPVIGHLDDLVIVPLLIYFALKFIPPNVILEARRKAENS